MESGGQQELSLDTASNRRFTRISTPRLGMEATMSDLSLARKSQLCRYRGPLHRPERHGVPCSGTYPIGGVGTPISPGSSRDHGCRSCRRARALAIGENLWSRRRQRQSKKCLPGGIRQAVVIARECSSAAVHLTDRRITGGQAGTRWRVSQGERESGAESVIVYC